jgi:hypothetical protein
VVGIPSLAYPTMPPGATGIWYASSAVSSPRKTIPNSISPSADPNLLSLPRSAFANLFRWNTNLVTPTDNNAVAPDGSTEASTLVCAAGAWSISWKANTNIPPGTYTIGFTVKPISGTANFNLGDSGGTFGAKTATAGWARYFQPFTSAGGTPNIAFFTSDNLAGTFQVCDFQLYAGSADLNTNWQTAKPIAITNMECVMALTNWDTASVSGGALQHGGLGVLQFPSITTPSTFTILYTVKRSGSRPNAESNAILSTYDGAGNAPQNFLIGFNSDYFGSIVNGAGIDAATGSGTQRSEDLFSQVGNGFYFVAHRYDGTTATIFLNNTKMMNNTIGLSPAAVRNLLVGGAAFGGLEGDHDVAALAYYPSALSDSAVQQAFHCWKSKLGLSLPNNRLVIFEGDSETAAGIPGVNFSYAYRYGQLTAIPCNGVNCAQAGNTLANLTGRASQVDAVFASSDARQFALSLMTGTNDLGTGATYQGNGSGYATAVAAYIDARISATPGLKVVLLSIPSRLDATHGGTQFNTDRAAYHAAAKTWVGGRLKAFIDLTSDSRIGTDTAPNNPTYFNADLIHYTDAAYAIIAPLVVTALDS